MSQIVAITPELRAAREDWKSLQKKREEDPLRDWSPAIHEVRWKFIDTIRANARETELKED